jgi:hypothetical protein
MVGDVGNGDLQSAIASRFGSGSLLGFAPQGDVATAELGMASDQLRLDEPVHIVAVEHRPPQGNRGDVQAQQGGVPAQDTPCREETRFSPVEEQSTIRWRGAHVAPKIFDNIVSQDGAAPTLSNERQENE